MQSLKRWLLSKVITPGRVRKIIAAALSWLMGYCIVRGTWESISATTAWLRRIADFVDRWNETELPADKDKLIADLVADAVTDDMVDKLVDTVSAMRAEAVSPSVRQPMLPGADKWE